MSCATHHVEDIHYALSVMQKTLECPICLDLMKEPVTTRCDHTFCRSCMSQLLSRKKKSGAQCPLCKKEITKRSLQESPRFKLVIDGLKKIISAFELDSGYKFFPSQDHASDIVIICEENRKNEEQTVVQSKGYRNRKKSSITIENQCEDQTTLLETNVDTLLIKDAEAENLSRGHCSKQEAKYDCKRTLNEPNCSKDDLFSNTNSLGNDHGRSYVLCEMVEGDDSPESHDEKMETSEDTSLTQETDEGVLSDLAECGFSERDLESTSRSVSIENTSSLKETTAKKSFLEVCAQSSINDLTEDTIDSKENDQAESTAQFNKYSLNKNQTLPFSVDDQYFKSQATTEEMASNQSSPISPSVKVPRKVRNISIQKVNEWLQKISEYFNSVSWNEELLCEVFPELDDDSSDKSSCTSGETEIMTKFCPSAVPGAAETTMNVRDKIFGRVYKREKKSSPAPKTVVARVRVNSGPDSENTKDKKKKLTSDLVEENISKREETMDKSYTNDDDNLTTDKPLSVHDSNYVSNDQSNTQTKSKIKNKKRKSEIASGSRTAPSLLLAKGSDISMDKQSPCHFSEIKINTFPSSNESQDKDDIINVRRSGRLSSLKKEEPSPKQKPDMAKTKAMKKTIDPGCSDSITETNFQRKQMSEDKKNTMLAPNGQEVPLVINVEIHPPPPECETSRLTDVGVQECMNMPAEPVRNVLSVENTDSDCDTQHLIKAFKTTKRMSFRLDPINEIDKKEHFTLINLSDTKTNLPNDSQAESALMVSDKKEKVIHTNDGKKGEEVMQQKCHTLNLPTRQGKTSERLKNITSSKESTESSEKQEVLPLLSDYELMFNADRLYILDPFNETEPHKVDNQEPNSDVGERETLVNRGVTTLVENGQEEKDYREHSFHEKQLNQMTSDNGSQGSVHSGSCQNSFLKSQEVYSDTPDGLLGIVDRSGEEHSFVAEAEKSFVFAKEPKVTASDSSKSPLNDSPLVKRKKRKAPMLESSDSESSEDEELPCFNTFLGIASNSDGQKNASSGLSPKQQGGGFMDMSPTCSSTSAKSSRVLDCLDKALPGSQQSVNLFSSQSSTPDHPTDVIIDQEFKNNMCHDKNGDTIPREQMLEESTNNETENPSGEQSSDETSDSDSELSSSTECEVYNTQQKNAMLNNLVKIREEMAVLEAELEQNTQSLKAQVSTLELNTVRLQEGSQKPTQHGTNISPAAVPETMMPSLKSVDQPVEQLVIGSKSTTPRQTRSRRQTQEKVCPTVTLSKPLKENALSPEEPKKMELSIECCPSSELDTRKPAETSVKQASASPRKSMRSTPQNTGAMSAVSTGERKALEANTRSLKRKADTIDINRPPSPTFTSPKRSRRGYTSKIPVVTNKRNFSLVASGLSQSELILVQKFAKKTQSVFSSEISESTTHVIMKTDEHLVCHRTMKYFLGIAGRKWVVSFNWIVQSFREGRILDEYDFEVKGDVISGRNHRGPRRSRLGSDGLLLSDFDICCMGNFKDMTRENLEWMVSLCGASSIKEPQMFEYKEGITSLVVVQGDGKANYAGLRKRYRAQVVSRDWVLDSVSSYKLQPFDTYLL